MARSGRGFDKPACEARDRVPVLRPALDLQGRYEFLADLRFEAAGLDFVVSAVLVGEQAGPDQAVVGHAPRPNLLAGHFVVIGYVDHSLIRW